MGLFQKLKSALGLNGAESTTSGPSHDVDVTVEREPSTEDEDAVKGTDTAATAEVGGVDTATEADSTEDTSAEIEDTEATTAEPDAEPASDAVSTPAGEPERESEPEPEQESEPVTTEAEEEAAATDASDTGATEGSSAPVTDIKGIGPAYAERLADVGIETVGELAAADAEAVAAETELSASRVEGWIERAGEY